MRMSVDCDDPGYLNWISVDRDSRKVAVYLDDVLIRDAVMADEEAGVVRRFCRANGEFVLDATNERISTEDLSGVVKIVLTDRDPVSHT